MSKLNQLSNAIQLRNHLALLQNLRDRLNKEELRAVAGLVQKIDRLVFNFAAEAVKELEENKETVNEQKSVKENAESKQEAGPWRINNLIGSEIKTAEVGQNIITIAGANVVLPFESAEQIWKRQSSFTPKIAEMPLGLILLNEDEKKLAELENKKEPVVESKTAETKKKRGPKAKVQISEPQGELEPVRHAAPQAPETLQNLEQSGRKGVFRRK